jgi:RNA polymerase sigma factor (sigma-70 family)
LAAHTDHTKLSDDELLLAFRGSGDNIWLGHLLQRYTTLLLGVAMKYLKDRNAAEDAVQHVFLKALTHIPKEQILNFKGWLYVLTRNHCLQQLRDAGHQAGDALLNHIPSATADREALQWEEQHINHLEHALQTLPDEQRTSVTLFYLKKMSYEQISAQTGFTFTQVKSYIQNGKRNLRISLTKLQNKEA